MNFVARTCARYDGNFGCRLALRQRLLDARVRHVNAIRTKLGNLIHEPVRTLAIAVELSGWRGALAETNANAPVAFNDFRPSGGKRSTRSCANVSTLIRKSKASGRYVAHPALAQHRRIESTQRSTAWNVNVDAQALVRRMTQQRALWALSPAFDMWQLDRTEGRRAPRNLIILRAR